MVFTRNLIEFRHKQTICLFKYYRRYKTCETDGKTHTRRETRMEMVEYVKEVHKSGLNEGVDSTFIIVNLSEVLNLSWQKFDWYLMKFSKN